MVQKGDLAAADEETAKYCGVTFQPANSEVAVVSGTQPYTGKY
jgi:hypothetical protein